MCVFKRHYSETKWQRLITAEPVTAFYEPGRFNTRANHLAASGRQVNDRLWMTITQFGIACRRARIRQRADWTPSTRVVYAHSP